MRSSHKQSGFSLIEMLVVLALIAILAIIVIITVTSLRTRSYDVKIRNNVGQLRLLAEQAYDSNGASYENWTTSTGVVNEVGTLRQDIEAVHDDSGSPWNYSVIIDGHEDSYCVSAELRDKDDGAYYCVDQSGRFKLVDTHCTDTGEPVTCPTS